MLQQAINEAALGGGTVKIEKHIKLSGPVVVSKGQAVAVASDEEFQIAGAKSAADPKNLFVARLFLHHPLEHGAEQPDEKAQRDLKRRLEEPTKPLHRRHPNLP